MARSWYDRLTALDNSFLIFEAPNAYMHVASTQIFAAGPLRRSDGGIDADAIKRMTAASLHLIPRYRQKLAWIPLQGHAVWVDDPHFNIDYHVRHTSLPLPGSEEQLKRLSARIMEQQLDRARPLWEMWVVEGLEGDRFALISKVHHCMIDGVSGVDLMRILMRLTPDAEIPEAPSYVPRPAPDGVELLRDELLRQATLPFSALRGIGRLLGEARDARRELGVRVRALRASLGATLRTPSDTPLNRHIGPHRRFDWTSMPLDEIKAVRKGLGGSLNDVVLTIVTGAVRRFLRRRQVDPARLEFRVMTPVSVRNEDQRGALGNRVSAWLLELPVGEADPRVQLDRIAETTAELKQSKHAVGAEMLSRVAEWTPGTLLSLGARNATRLLPFNLVVTNVPGPQLPLYMLGARLLEVYPHVPLMDNLALGVALMSYDGSLFWGVNADYDVVPDVADFVRDVEDAFAEVKLAASPAALRRKRVARRREAPPTPAGRGNGADADANA
jgi:diacylglycerol O-acyltransferase / wax synthase